MTVDELRIRLPPRLAQWARQIYAASLCYDLDPFIVAAVMDRESLGGEALGPKGPEGTGDNGHGRGLMQIDNRTHASFIFSLFPDNGFFWKDPAFNVLYGARLLRRNLDVAEGDIEVAVAAYNCGIQKALKAKQGAAARVSVLVALDRVTTNGNYVSDVMNRRNKFADEPIGGTANESS